MGLAVTLAFAGFFALFRMTRLVGGRNSSGLFVTLAFERFFAALRMTANVKGAAPGAAPLNFVTIDGGGW